MKKIIDPSSLFSSFFFLWFVCYVFNFFLINNIGVELQLPVHFDKFDLYLGLFLATLSFFLIIFFSTKFESLPKDFFPGPPSNLSLVLIGFIPLGFAVNFFIKVNILTEGIRQLTDATTIRNSSTFYFLFLDFVTVYAILFITLFKVNSRKTLFLYVAILGLFLWVSFVMGQLFYSRRFIGLPLVCLFTHIAILFNKKKALLLITILTVLLAPSLNQLRHITSTSLSTSSSDRTNSTFVKDFDERPHIFFQSISSSYEGLGHLAEYINTSSINQIIFGRDFGLSNLYNLGLSYVPRKIWSTKPPLTGSTYQQSVIYPASATNPISMATFPLGYIVDFIFGFGVFGIILFSALFAFFFRLLDEFLSNERKSYGYFLSIFCFCQLFNFLRGGTAFIGNLLPSMLFIGIVIALNLFLNNYFNGWIYRKKRNDF